jgi:dihydrodipicolinate synthase/N-acetylneuraminate lyase
MTTTQPQFPGVLAATTTPFKQDHEIDLDAFAAHCEWLISEGVHGLVPCGSLGEYETMTDDERSAAFAVAAEVSKGRAQFVPGVSGKSAREAVRWAQRAAELGADGVMCLPPTSHSPTGDEVVAHFTEVAAVGLPVIAYNNPFSTRVDLTPSLLARLAGIGGVVGVKEFSQDVRRVAQIHEQAPSLEVLVGCDDLLAEGVLMGATGWIAGFVNAFPSQSVRLFDLASKGQWNDALPLYRAMLPALRWDAMPEFVQAIKLGQEEAGRYGGPVRLPRLPLSAADEARARRDVRAALTATV